MVQNCVGLAPNGLHYWSCCNQHATSIHQNTQQRDHHRPHKESERTNTNQQAVMFPCIRSVHSHTFDIRGLLSQQPTHHKESAVNLHRRSLLKLAYRPSWDVDTTRLTLTARRTTRRPAQASRPLVPRLYSEPPWDQMSGV